MMYHIQYINYLKLLCILNIKNCNFDIFYYHPQSIFQGIHQDIPYLKIHINYDMSNIYLVVHFHRRYIFRSIVCIHCVQVQDHFHKNNPHHIRLGMTNSDKNNPTHMNNTLQLNLQSKFCMPSYNPDNVQYWNTYHQGRSLCTLYHHLKHSQENYTDYNFYMFHQYIQCNLLNKGHKFLYHCYRKNHLDKYLNICYHVDTLYYHIMYNFDWKDHYILCMQNDNQNN